MLKIAICDAGRRYAKDLEWGIKVWAANTGRNVRIKMYHEGGLLLSFLKENGMFDLIFLDIDMEGVNGLEVAAKIRETDLFTSIIFTSQFEDYCKEAYEAHPFYFLSKPVSPRKLEETMEAYMKMKKQDIETFTCVINKAQYNLRLNDIMYFYSERRHVIAVCPDGRYSFYGKLIDVQNEMEKKTTRFLRIHQSYLVNMKYVKEYHYGELVLYTGQVLMISKENRRKMRDIHVLLAEE